jgi:hypothetical protein
VELAIWAKSWAEQDEAQKEETSASINKFSCFIHSNLAFSTSAYNSVTRPCPSLHIGAWRYDPARAKKKAAHGPVGYAVQEVSKTASKGAKNGTFCSGNDRCAVKVLRSFPASAKSGLFWLLLVLFLIVSFFGSHQGFVQSSGSVATRQSWEAAGNCRGTKGGAIFCGRVHRQDTAGGWQKSETSAFTSQSEISQ